MLAEHRSGKRPQPAIRAARVTFSETPRGTTIRVTADENCASPIPVISRGGRWTRF